jgi:hypothetical protein
MGCLCCYLVFSACSVSNIGFPILVCHSYVISLLIFVYVVSFSAFKCFPFNVENVNLRGYKWNEIVTKRICYVNHEVSNNV